MPATEGPLVTKPVKKESVTGEESLSWHNPRSTGPPVTTGFENKSLRQLIENWLYTDDLTILMDATSELRRRFRKRFPRPAWATTEGFTAHE